MCGRFDQSQTARHYANLIGWTDAVFDSESKPTPNADAAWELTNEVEAERARFHLARGFYAQRSLEECASEAERLLHKFERSRRAGRRRVEWNPLHGSFFRVGQLSGAAAVAIAVCIFSAQEPPANSMPPLTASQKRRLAQKCQVNAKARLSRYAVPDLIKSK